MRWLLVALGVIAEWTKLRIKKHCETTKGVSVSTDASTRRR